MLRVSFSRVSGFVSFQYRDFRFLWGSTFFTALGMGMEGVGLGWLVLKMTDSPLMVGTAFAVLFAPFFFLGILTGAVADRVERRVVLRFVTFGSSLAALLMALILLADVARVWFVMLLALPTGCFWAFTQTIRGAYTYDVVGRTHALNGLALVGLSQRAGFACGALLAGAIISMVGVGEMYLAAGLIYLIGLSVLLGTRGAGQVAPTQRSSVMQNIFGYISLVRSNRTLTMLLLVTVSIEVFGFTQFTWLPLFARDVLGVGGGGLGIMKGVGEWGAFFGLTVLAGLGTLGRRGLLICVLATLAGLAFVIISTTANMFQFLALLACANGCLAATSVLNQTTMQSVVANEQRGRAAGVWVLGIGTAPLGHLGIGAIAGPLGAPVTLLIVGGMLMLTGLVSAWPSRMRSLM